MQTNEEKHKIAYILLDGTIFNAVLPLVFIVAWFVVVVVVAVVVVAVVVVVVVAIVVVLVKNTKEQW